MLILGVEAGPFVVLAGRREREIRLIDLPLQRSLFALQVPGVRVRRLSTRCGRWYVRSHFLSVGLPGRLQQSVAHTASEGQIGQDSPGVLDVSLILIGAEVTANRRTV